MKAKVWISTMFGVCVLGLLFASSASAQVTQDRLKATKARLDQMKALYNKLPPLHQQLLDGSKNAVHLATVWNHITPGLLKHQPTRPRIAADAHVRIDQPISGVVGVSDPTTDLDFSGFGGFTQSETHSAWCGNSAVVGFNDSGSLFETLLLGTGGLAFSGVAQSTDGGLTFHDLGPVNPGSNTLDFLLGDPAIACSDSNTFYYSQIYSTGTLSSPLAATAVSKSTDGGATWGNPVAAVAKDAFNHLIDKDWMAVDPTNPKRVYVSYTDFDASGFSGSGPCPNDFRNAIEFVSSHDGGATWGKPHVVDQLCGFANAVQGSQIAVGSDGAVHVAWEAFINFPTGPREIRSRAFDPKTGKLGPKVTVDKVVGGGDEYYLQGGFRDFLGVSMNIDRSATPSAGTLYIAWDDGRDKAVPDVTSFSGTYAYDDIVLAVSFDGGASWFTGGRVNTDLQPRFALGHDHFQPGVAVDNTGKVAVCWYDRRGDPENFAISRFCGSSTTQGFSWTNTQVQIPPFAPVHGIDVLVNPVYMGDYDGLTSDFTGANPGFIGAFQFMGSTANPDVLAVKFQ